jgi:pimeloyl-ACP methyl ester carboxylesterase
MTASSSVKGEASTASLSPTRTFVLVHGAWHGGWCWRAVQDMLTANGCRVFAPSLTGVGDRAHLFSKDISLQTHVDDILSLIEAEELTDFVLVGHSYGGLVITGVADILRERVSHYVYLDASLPDDMSAGASLGWSDSNSAELREARLKAVREQGNGVGLPPPPPDAFAVTEGSDFAWVQRRLRPMPLQAYLGKITLKNKGSAGLKRTYIAAVRPPYLPLVATHERVKADKSWSFTPIEAGHDAMIIAPSELSALLMEA